MSSITIFTPVHKLDWKVTELYNSLCVQTDKNFTWLVLLNGDAEAKDSDLLALLGLSDFPSWMNVMSHKTTGNIGALKSACCRLVTTDIAVEWDYDDIATQDAVEKIRGAFEDDAVKFVYSNCVEFQEKWDIRKPKCTIYGAQYGWKARPFRDGYTQLVAFKPSAHYMRRVEWAPNHVRAWRMDAYNKIGGYNTTIAVGDDHELICRFYIEYGDKGFRHLDECIYLYRVHPDNTCNGANRNKEVQEQVDKNYCMHAEKMYMKWAKDHNLLCLDLGGRFNCPTGCESCDLRDADHVFDLRGDWPFEDGSIGVLRAYHLLEHLPDTIDFFNKAYQKLAPGGFLLIEVPDFLGLGGVSDPTHIKFFNERSFGYFTNQNLAKFIQPQYTGKFQVARQAKYNWEDGVTVISCQLIALKGWYDAEWCGERLM